jgi:hypothetical protein
MKAKLVLYFRRNGCIRVPNEKRQKKEGQDYKKGYEVRFTSFTKKELRFIRYLLRRKRFSLGASYEKGKRFVQPVYGRENLRRFRKLLRS